MPRDAGGNYTLPSGNPVVTGTVITSTWANPTMSDIANEITNSLSREGQGGMLVPLEFFDGTENAPGITFTNEPTAGMYRPANGQVGIASQGVTIGLFKAATGNIEVEGLVPTAAADLTRKDYVDARFVNAFPVGALVFGWNPNSILDGTWTQLPEGTFIMNTVGGADVAGGSNDAAVIDHAHTVTDPGHDHPITDPGHTHTYNEAYEAANSASGSGDTEHFNRTGTTSSKVTGITVNSAPTDLTVDNEGVSGTGLNKPLYKGVEVWERTA